ncbi:MAG: ABC transporter ATP-binding protein [Spirochaetaceae bacterium]|nr:ABC transporter ATP-binding protein [Spirochaetaceae bacterium]
MEKMETQEPAVRPRFGGRRYGLVSGTWIVFQDAPLAAVTRAAVTLAAGAATGPLLVLATERFVATALDVAGGSLPPVAIAAPVIALGALFAMQIVESVVRALADARIEACLRRGFRADLTRKRARLDYHHVERSSTWDLMRRVAAGPEAQARQAPENGPVKQAFDDGVGLAALAVRVIGLAAVLARLGWWIVPAAVAITVPFVLLGIRSGRRHYELERKLSGRRRRAEYLSEEVLQGREAAQERALFDFGDYVSARWRVVYDEVRRLTVRWIVRLWVRYKGAAFPAIVVVIAAMLALLRPLRTGVIDIAFYVAAVMAFLQAERVVTQELVQITSRLSQHREFFVDLTALSAMAETPRALTRRAPEQVFRSIEFAGVSFTYPGTRQPVLTDVSFVLAAGRHYALVGANGSGKSTIAKLMMGLYRPDGGRILINGTPIAEWPQDALNGLFGVVFQDFARYSLTVRDNVEVAAAGRLDDATVQASLARAGLGDDFVLRLPQGYDTPLGKVLRGGVDVSGGEWQRLAMARSLAADAPVRILDEPTAALDPLAESELYRSYSRAATGLTTLLISHRLGSTRIADRILVVDGGAIVESGTHDGLMGQDGLYARMFAAQRYWYETG